MCSYLLAIHSLMPCGDGFDRQNVKKDSHIVVLKYVESNASSANMNSALMRPKKIHGDDTDTCSSSQLFFSVTEAKKQPKNDGFISFHSSRKQILSNQGSHPFSYNL